MSDNFDVDPFQNSVFEPEENLDAEDIDSVDFADSNLELEEFEENESETPEVPDSDSRRHGNHVNELYAEWLAAPNSNNQSALLEDVTAFALRIIRKKSPNNLNAEDIAQAATLKVWLNLLKVEITSKFSSCIFTVFSN